MKNLVLVGFLAMKIITTPALAKDERPSKERAEGGLPKEAIDETIRKSLPQASNCYARQLSTKPAHPSRVRTKFVIGADGKVTKAEIESTTSKNDAAEKCLVGVLNQIVFPKPIGGETVNVSYPFTFAPNVKSGEPASVSESEND